MCASEFWVRFTLDVATGALFTYLILLTRREQRLLKDAQENYARSRANLMAIAVLLREMNPLSGDDDDSPGTSLH